MSNGSDLYVILAVAGFGDKVYEQSLGKFVLVPNHGLSVSDQAKVQQIILGFDQSDAAAAIRKKRANWGGDLVPPKALAALFIKNSTLWGTLNTTQQQAVQAAIDSAATTVIAAMKA